MKRKLHSVHRVTRWTNISAGTMNVAIVVLIDARFWWLNTLAAGISFGMATWNEWRWRRFYARFWVQPKHDLRIAHDLGFDR